MIVEKLFQQIDQGREGYNHGFSTGIPKLDSIIDGVMRQTYTTIFSDSGSGKSSLTQFSFIYKPICESIKNNDENYFCYLFSLEMNSEMILAKMLSTYIFEKFHKELSIKQLLSREQNYVLSDEDYKLIKNCKPWLIEVEKRLKIYDKGLNADILYSLLMKELQRFGHFEENENHKTFIWNNPKCIFLIVLDHISLLRPNKGRNLKQEIDLTSAELLTLRNIASVSPVVIQQANREQGNIERRKQGMINFSITDTRDSANPVNDSEIVISILNPFRNRLNNYKNYDISLLRDSFRSITVLKSRYGESDVEIGVNYFGRINEWHELPLPNEIYDYCKYQEPNYIVDKEQLDNKIDNNTDNNKLDNKKFNFIIS